MSLSYRQYLLKRINVDSNNCWNWTKYIMKNGYGRLTYENTQKLAHRFSYEIFIGKIVNDLFVLHKCDNKRCINPKHLYLGTQQQNIKDSMNRNLIQKGEIHYHAKISSIDVDEIRIKYSTRKYTQKQLGNLYGITGSQISRIVNFIWRKAS